MSRRYSGRDDGGAGPLLFVVFFFLLGAFMVWFSANGGTDFLDPLLREWGVIFR